MSKNKTLEHSLQEACCKYLVLKKFLVVRINSSAMTTDNRYLRSYIIQNNKKSSGLSDIIAFKNGTALFIEIKFGKNKQTEGQVEFEKLCKKTNNIYIVINSLDQLMEVVK